MAIGGVSSISLRFRRPRGVKGPVADTFHKIGQIDVKTRQLNRVLSTIDSSINLISNIHSKIEAGALGGKSFGDKASTIGGMLGFDSDWGGYGDIQGTIRKLQRFFYEHLRDPDVYRGYLKQDLQKQDITTDRPQTKKEIEADRLLKLTRLDTERKLKHIASFFEASEVSARQLGEYLQSIPEDSDAIKRHSVPMRHHVRDNIRTLELFPQLLERSGVDQLVHQRRIDARYSPYRQAIHDRLGYLGQFEKKLLEIHAKPRATEEDITTFYNENDIKKSISLFNDLAKRTRGLAEVSKKEQQSILRQWKLLNKEIEAINKKNAKAEKQMDDLGDETKKVSDTVGGFAHNTGRASKGVKKLGREVESLDDDVDDATEGVEKLNRAMEDMDKTSKKIKGDKTRRGKGVAGDGATPNIGRGVILGMGPGAAMASTYSLIAPYLVMQNVTDFSKQMGTIRAETLGTGLSPNKLKDSILGISGSSRFTSSDVASAVVGAVRSGFQIKEDLRGIRNLTTLATAENVGLETAYSAIEPIMSTLNVGLTKLPGVADKLSAATSTGATTLQELGWIAGRGLSVHLETGGSFNEFLAMIPVLRSSGVGRERTATAMSNMQMMFSQLAVGKGTKTQKDALTKIGIKPKESFYDSQGYLKSTLEITKVLHDATKASGVNVADTVIGLFGKEIGRSVIPLFSDDKLEKVAKGLEKISKSTGETGKKQRVQQGTIYGQWQSIVSASEEVLIRMFGGDEKHFAGILGRIAEKIREFGAFLKVNASSIEGGFIYISAWMDRNDDRIISLFTTIGKAVLSVGKVFAKLIGWFAEFALKFQGIVSFLVKFWLYAKALKFFFMGFFTFFIGGFTKLFLLVKAVGFASLFWSKHFIPAISKMITKNKVLAKGLQFLLNTIAGSKMSAAGKGLLTEQIEDFIKKKGDFKEGVKALTKVWVTFTKTIWKEGKRVINQSLSFVKKITGAAVGGTSSIIKKSLDWTSTSLSSFFHDFKHSVLSSLIGIKHGLARMSAPFVGVYGSVKKTGKTNIQYVKRVATESASNVGAAVAGATAAGSETAKKVADSKTGRKVADTVTGATAGIGGIAATSKKVTSKIKEAFKNIFTSVKDVGVATFTDAKKNVKSNMKSIATSEFLEKAHLDLTQQRTKPTRKIPPTRKGPIGRFSDWAAASYIAMQSNWTAAKPHFAGAIESAKVHGKAGISRIKREPKLYKRHGKKALSGFAQSAGPSAKLGTKTLLGPKLLTFIAKTELFVKNIWALLSSFTALKVTIAGVIAGTAPITGPLIAAVTIVTGAIIGLGAIIIRNWDKIKSFFSALVGFFKAIFIYIWTFIRYVIFMIDQKFPIIGKVVRAVGSTIKNVFVGIFVTIWKILKGIGSFIENLIIKPIEWITDKLTKMTRFLKNHIFYMRFRMKHSKQMDKKGGKGNFDNKIIEDDGKHFERKKISNADIKGNQSQTFSQTGSSIQFVNFKGLNEVQVTLESGFQSIVDVNTQILDTLTPKNVVEGSVGISPPNINNQGSSSNVIENINITIEGGENINVEELVERIKQKLTDELRLNQF